VSANLIAPKLDATVFVFVLIVSLLTGFLFGAITIVHHALPLPSRYFEYFDLTAYSTSGYPVSV
jgi:hypothetical protein